MKKFMVLVMALIGAQFASAAETEGSEFMHQAPVGKWELTPGLGYTMYDYDLKGTSPSSSEKSGLREVVLLEYGLDDSYSAGLWLSMSSLKTSYSPSGSRSGYTTSGLEDPKAIFHGKYALPMGLLRYGVDVTMSLSKAKKDSSGDYNNSNGGIGFEPFVGWEKASGACTMGVRLAYATWLGDRKFEDEVPSPSKEYKISGAEITTLSGFWEHQANEKLMIGGSLAIGGIAKTETKLSSSPNTVTKTAGMTLATLQVYGSYKATESTTILPTVSYLRDLAKDNAVYDGITAWLIGAGARFVF